MEETKEKDKKYNGILGIMIFLFIIIVGIVLAWGLGYIQFGKQLKNNDVSVNDTNVDNENKEEVKDDNATLLAEAYKKYDFDWVSKKKNEAAYVENEVLKISNADKEDAKVEFTYGIPKMACGLPGHDFWGFVVLNNDGEVYICEELIYTENGIDVDAIKFRKLDLQEKIVDISFAGKESAVPYSGPYFMTEIGKVVDKNGNTYEEINKDHVAYAGTPGIMVYICGDDTLELPRTTTEYIKIIDENGKEVKAKTIFMDSSEGNELVYIITDKDKLYKVGTEANGVAYEETDKEVKGYSYNNNIVEITYKDGTTDTYESVYVGYDLETDKDF